MILDIFPIAAEQASRETGYLLEQAPVADVLCFGTCKLMCCTPFPNCRKPSLTRVEGIHLSLSGNGGNVAAVLGRLGISADLAGFRGADRSAMPSTLFWVTLAWAHPPSFVIPPRAAALR